MMIFRHSLCICFLFLSILTINGQSYSQLAKTTATDRQAFDYFGHAVANSNDYAVFGAPNEDHDLTGNNSLDNSGAAYVISRVTGATQKLVASDRQALARFGWSVAIFDNYIVVGAHRNNTDSAGNNSLPEAGAAYVFQLDATTGHWTEIQKLVAADRNEGATFGHAVSISNNHLVIGTQNEKEDANDSNTLLKAGAVYDFQLIGGLWIESQKLTPQNRSSYAQFGYSLDVHNGWLIVGSLLESRDADDLNPLTYAGAAYIFELNLGNSWDQVQKIVASDRDPFDHFGRSVAISDNYALVGVPSDDGSATLINSGSVYAYGRTAANEWPETQKLTNATPFAHDIYGNSVDILNDKALVGIPFYDYDAAGNNHKTAAGAVDVLQLDGTTGNWMTVQRLVHADRDNTDSFGTDVSISDLFIVAGTPNERHDVAGNNSLFDSGSAYIFAQSYCVDPDVPVLSATPLNCLGESVTITINGNLNHALYWAVYEDGCGATMVEGTNTNSITLFPTSPTTTYYIRGEDVAGCVDETTGACGMIVVTLQDNVPPVAICQDITISLDANGDAFITAADVDGGSYDNCAIALSVVAPNHFDCDDIGINTATIQMNDANYNGAYCNAQVTVVDNTPPMAICQDITISLDANGEAFITAADVDGGSYDNCGIQLSVVAPTHFDCNDLGVNTATIQMNDVNSNGSFCNAQVTVIDNSPPVAICQDITVALDASGNAFITASAIDGGSYDNCGNVFMAAAQTHFTTADIGVNISTLQIWDGNGNGASCEASVTVVVTPAALVNNSPIETAEASNKTKDISVAIYPNPAADLIQLSAPQAVELRGIVIYTSSGAQLAEYNITDNNHFFEINISDLTSGVYFMRIKTGGLPIIKPFIKK